jgi:lathosterol oxidase
MLPDKLILWQGIVLIVLYFFLAFSVHLFFSYAGKKWKDYKINKGTVHFSQLKREITYSLFSLLIFIIFGFLTYSLYLNGYTLIYSFIEERGFIYFFISFFLTLVLHDSYFYWTHRFMHLPWVFPFIHKTHHLSHHTTAFSALAFHPGEAIIQVAFIPLLTLFLPLHPIIIYCFIIYNLVVNILGHSGYEFFSKKFRKSLLGRFSNTPFYHHLHHFDMKKNYGLYLSLWDKMMGTYNKNTENL